MDTVISIIVGVVAVAFVVFAILIYRKNKDKLGGGCCGDCSKCKSCSSKKTQDK
jgi:hypothetical protein